jgi:Type IX secretion system protein PorV
MKRKILAIITSLVVICPVISEAQLQQTFKISPLGAAVPFLGFSPDARHAALGDAGAAASPDANSAFWNTAQLAFIDKSMGASVSYTPWLADLVNDMAIMHGSFYKKVGKDQVLGLSMTYFNEGQIEFTTATGQSAGTFQSKEFFIAGSYTRKLTKNFSMGLNLKYINSNLVGAYVVNNTASKPGTSVAGDISAYYVKDNFKGDKDAKIKSSTFAFGAVISNLGGTISYGRGEYYLPANLKVGGAYTKNIDEHNKFTLLLDMNKLLVPTSEQLAANPNQGVIGAVFSSIGSTQVKDFTASSGLEYWYDDMFAARAGYFFEAESRGGRKYFMAGLGLRLKESYGIDLAYLLPTTVGSPLANTWRISLIFNLDAKKGNAPAIPVTEEKSDNE